MLIGPFQKNIWMDQSASLIRWYSISVSVLLMTCLLLRTYQNFNLKKFIFTLKDGCYGHVTWWPYELHDHMTILRGLLKQLDSIGKDNSWYLTLHDCDNFKFLCHRLYNQLIPWYNHKQQSNMFRCPFIIKSVCIIWMNELLSYKIWNNLQRICNRFFSFVCQCQNKPSCDCKQTTSLLWWLARQNTLLAAGVN